MSNSINLNIYNKMTVLNTFFHNVKHFLTKEIAIDLGTANTLIYYNGKMILDEPSIVAVNRRDGKVLCVGRYAREMHGKTHENVKTIRPLKDGVIADFNAAEQMIKGLIQMTNLGLGVFSSLRVLICIPSGITEVEKRAVKDSAEHVGAKEVFLIHEPMAAALGIGINVLEPTGHMIVDIGGGTTEIAVIALGGIVSDCSIRVAGDEFTKDIEEYIRRQHNMLIGERTAEQIKIEVGAALEDIENPPAEFAVRGRDLLTGIPKELKVSHVEIAAALDKSISKVEEAILSGLEKTPPELCADIHQQGIWLAGGGALLRGLDKRIALKTKLKVYIAEDPLRAVGRGTSIALANLERFKFIEH